MIISRKLTQTNKKKIFNPVIVLVSMCRDTLKRLILFITPYSQLPREAGRPI